MHNSLAYSFVLIEQAKLSISHTSTLHPLPRRVFPPQPPPSSPHEGVLCHTDTGRPSRDPLASGHKGTKEILNVREN